jgi:hypothetical protein
MNEKRIWKIGLSIGFVFFGFFLIWAMYNIYYTSVHDESTLMLVNMFSAVLLIYTLATLGRAWMVFVRGD